MKTSGSSSSQKWPVPAREGWNNLMAVAETENGRSWGDGGEKLSWGLNESLAACSGSRSGLIPARESCRMVPSHCCRSGTEDQPHPLSPSLSWRGAQQCPRGNICLFLFCCTSQLPERQIRGFLQPLVTTGSMFISYMSDSKLYHFEGEIWQKSALSPLFAFTPWFLH